MEHQPSPPDNGLTPVTLIEDYTRAKADATEAEHRHFKEKYDGGDDSPQRRWRVYTTAAADIQPSEGEVVRPELAIVPPPADN